MVISVLNNGIIVLTLFRSPMLRPILNPQVLFSGKFFFFFCMFLISLERLWEFLFIALL